MGAGAEGVCIWVLPEGRASGFVLHIFLRDCLPSFIANAHGMFQSREHRSWFTWALSTPGWRVSGVWDKAAPGAQTLMARNGLLGCFITR